MTAPPRGVSAHAYARFEERIGRQAAHEDWVRAVLDIIDGRAVLLRKLPDGLEEFAINVGPVACRALWSRTTGMMVTIKSTDMAALPPSVLGMRRGRMKELVTKSEYRWLRGSKGKGTLRTRGVEDEGADWRRSVWEGEEC